jgi:hypothetical protein
MDRFHASGNEFAMTLDDEDITQVMPCLYQEFTDGVGVFCLAGVQDTDGAPTGICLDRAAATTDEFTGVDVAYTRAHGLVCVVHQVDGAIVQGQDLQPAVQGEVPEHAGGGRGPARHVGVQRPGRGDRDVYLVVPTGIQERGSELRGGGPTSLCGAPRSACASVWITSVISVC